MNTHKLELTVLQQRIFQLLCKRAGQKLNQQEIARTLHATSAGIAKALPPLIANDLVTIEKSSTMNLNLITLNRNQPTMRLKQLENLRQIYSSGLLETLEEHFAGSTIILFGSFARGEDTTRSDIDIAIIGVKQKSIDLSIFKQHLERPITLQYYSSLQKVHKELRENLCNGIVLSGSISL
jgi:predicted nucleotidyltransferase